ncbi:MAG: hypothetical protein ABIV28_01670 [Longimicrobiales bacterium]
MKRLMVAAAVTFALAAPMAASAQAWDSPLLMPPNMAEEFGIYLVDVHAGGVGVMGTWRATGYNFGLRAGVAERDDAGIGIFGGIDYIGTINRSTDEFPLDIDWVLGVGVGIGDGLRISAPLGLTGGHSFVGEGATFTPYVTPRVVLDAFTNSDTHDGLSLGFALDLGLDLKFASKMGGPLGGTLIRFGGTIGDRSAVALGLVF